MTLTYKKSQISDAELLISIYNAAFYADYIRYGECPGYGKAVDVMENSIKRFPKYIICCDKKPVGVISMKNQGNGQYYVGCLCIIPEYQGKGIGTAAFHHIQTIYGDFQRISLITPADKEQNIKFYTQKCGFSLGAHKMDGNVEVVELYKER